MKKIFLRSEGENLLKMIVTLFLIWALGALPAMGMESGSGVVQETMDVGSYVYVRLGDEGPWVAASSIPVSVGDTVEYTGGALMKNFHSSRLNRTFDEILFAMRLQVVDRPGDSGPADQQASPHAGLPGSSEAAESVAEPQAGEIAPLEGGVTVAEVLDGHPHEPGLEVRLRARVMKFNPGIMGKNWVTLKDGTASENGDKLIASTQEDATPGETLIVSGRVVDDADLGFGYIYKVMLEEAKFER